jgi:integrase
VNELQLNDNVVDDRQKVVFHTLRHTFASWLVQAGTPIYTVANLMGHSTIAMTQRYAHLAPEGNRAAAMKLNDFLSVSD